MLALIIILALASVAATLLIERYAHRQAPFDDGAFADSDERLAALLGKTKAATRKNQRGEGCDGGQRPNRELLALHSKNGPTP